MEAFFDRKNPKFNLDKKLKEASQSWVFQFISSHFETPSRKVILKNAVAFVALGILTVLFPSEDGPTFQVAISLGLTIYFLYQRIKSRLWAFLYGYGLSLCYFFPYFLEEVFKTLLLITSRNSSNSTKKVFSCWNLRK
jgi:Protein CHAPERONE-LIKE PROTEIN OF POR1-like